MTQALPNISASTTSEELVHSPSLLSLSRKAKSSMLLGQSLIELPWMSYPESIPKVLDASLTPVPSVLSLTTVSSSSNVLDNHCTYNTDNVTAADDGLFWFQDDETIIAVAKMAVAAAGGSYARQSLQDNLDATSANSISPGFRGSQKRTAMAQMMLDVLKDHEAEKSGKNPCKPSASIQESVWTLLERGVSTQSQFINHFYPGEMITHCYTEQMMCLAPRHLHLHRPLPVDFCQGSIPRLTKSFQSWPFMLMVRTSPTHPMMWLSLAQPRFLKNGSSLRKRRI